MADGRVLVVGGSPPMSPGTFGGCLRNSQLFDPATNTWTAPAATAQEHCGAALVRLDNGKALVVGAPSPVRGYPVNAAWAELFDPVTGTWTVTGNQPTQREAPAAAKLSDGRVLMTGGTSSADRFAAWLYDPTSNQWSTAAPMISPERREHTMSTIANGVTIVVGGRSNAQTASSAGRDFTDRYANGAFGDGKPLLNRRWGHAAVVMASGDVMVIGGSHNNFPVFAAEFYTLGPGWRIAPSPVLTYRSGHTATLLADGRVLLIGGTRPNGGSQGEVELFDPATGQWSFGPRMSYPRGSHTATRLDDGRVLVEGGSSSATVPPEIFVP